MNKILITGVAGFLGSNLANILIKDENNIIYGIDNLSCSKITNIYSLLKNERFNFIEQDLINDRIIQQSDCIYHLAGNGDDNLYLDNKYEHAINTLKITNNILNYAKLSGSKIIIPVCYTDYQKHNHEYFIKYDTNRLIQDLVGEFSSRYKLDCKIAKITNGYGLYMSNDDNRFIANTIIKAYNNQDIILKYDSSDYFIFSNDIAYSLIEIMDKFSNSNVIEISQPNLHLKSDIAKLIISFTKSKSKIIIETNDVYHPSYKPNLNALNNELNFRCSTPILEGMSKTIDYFRKIYFS